MGIMNMLMENILDLMKLLLLDGMIMDGLLKILLVLFGGIKAFLKLNLIKILILIMLLLPMEDLLILIYIYSLFF